MTAELALSVLLLALSAALLAFEAIRFEERVGRYSLHARLTALAASGLVGGGLAVAGVGWIYLAIA